MLSTDITDILFGTPVPLTSEVNMGSLEEDEVNIIIHGHEPLLSELILMACQDPEMIEYAKTKGAKGINLTGICCTANEILMRQGVRSAGNFLSQELAIATGAVEAMVVDIQCIMQALVPVAEHVPHQADHHLAQGQDHGRHAHASSTSTRPSRSPRRSSRRASTTSPTAARPRRSTSPTSAPRWWPASPTSTCATCRAATTAAPSAR